MIAPLPTMSSCRRSPGGQDGPVHVCFLIDELARAGTETQLLALVRHLDRSRVLPHLCLLRGDSPLSRSLEPADVPLLRLGVGALASLATLKQALRFARWLRAHRIEVLQTYFPDSTYFGLPAAWLAGAPYRLRTRNNLGHWLTPLHRLLGRLLGPLTTRTLTNCHAARSALLAAEAPRPGSVVVLENGVDVERFQNVAPVAPWSEGTIVRIGALANLRPVKGLEVLIDAAALVACDHPHVRFEVGGEGQQRDALQRHMATRGLTGRLVLSGAVRDVPAFLAGLHIAVLSSHSEGMSNAVLEYMAAGRPTVATAVGATPELIADGVHGLLVPPGDAIALAAALDRLVRQPALAVRMGEAARRRACEHYSRQRMIERFEDFYVALARPGPRAHG